MVDRGLLAEGDDLGVRRKGLEIDGDRRARGLGALVGEDEFGLGTEVETGGVAIGAGADLRGTPDLGLVGDRPDETVEVEERRGDVRNGIVLIPEVDLLGITMPLAEGDPPVGRGRRFACREVELVDGETDRPGAGGIQERMVRCGGSMGDCRHRRLEDDVGRAEIEEGLDGPAGAVIAHPELVEIAREGPALHREATESPLALRRKLASEAEGGDSDPGRAHPHGPVRAEEDLAAGPVAGVADIAVSVEEIEFPVAGRREIDLPAGRAVRRARPDPQTGPDPDLGLAETVPDESPLQVAAGSVLATADMEVGHVGDEGAAFRDRDEASRDRAVPVAADVERPGLRLADDEIPAWAAEDAADARQAIPADHPRLERAFRR